MFLGRTEKTCPLDPGNLPSEHFDDFGGEAFGEGGGFFFRAGYFREFSCLHSYEEEGTLPSIGDPREDLSRLVPLGIGVV